MIDCPGIVPASAQDTQTAKVLKGVVRVEALATPSEHIPTLMSRVRPVYLARTYNLEAPESEEPFDPDEVLDKLARMKGRLLKGGEPDLDGVAKILLSDWVRGKIPYFVPPPERPEELNKAEEAKRKREEAKGKRKGEAADERDRLRAIGVRQNLGSIIQKNAFVGDDIKSIEEEDEDLEEDGGEGEVDGEEDGSEEGDELGWNDIFPEDAPLPIQSDDESAEEGGLILSPDVDDIHTDEEEDTPAQREARMTTNKVSLPHNQAKQTFGELIPRSLSVKPRISTRAPTSRTKAGRKRL